MLECHGRPISTISRFRPSTGSSTTASQEQFKESKSHDTDSAHRPFDRAQCDDSEHSPLGLKSAPLAGFVVEGLTPYGRTVSNARHRLMLRAVQSGLPVVRVGPGNAECVPLHDPCVIGGSNLTAAMLSLNRGALSLRLMPKARTQHGHRGLQHIRVCCCPITHPT